ncbi:hypothetical protein JCM10212_002470 [Sporobolomyces blumeae]
MSSFDQSRGFQIPSSFTRHESWNASDGWGTSPGGPPAAPPPSSPPLPTSSSLSSQNGFQQFAHAAAHDLNPQLAQSHTLDYSVIDAGTASPFGDHLDTVNEPRPWQLDKFRKVTVHLKPTLEGTLLQKHHVWVVEQATSSTERRYSDFVWLLDCLQHRYPFRLLPSLPPKSIQYQGHFLGQDDGFLDRRKKGLERCLTVLVNHPVLKLDGILQTFLNEQADLSSYRKQTTLSLAEESTTRTLTPQQLASLPSDLDHRFASLRVRLPTEIDLWTKISVTCDRIAHRRLNQAGEWAKLSGQVDAALKLETNGVPPPPPSSVDQISTTILKRKSVASSHSNGTTGSSGGGGADRGVLHWRPREAKTLDRDLEETRKAVKDAGDREEASAKRLLEGWVEDVKRHRELYTNLRDLFHRQATLGIDHVDKLQKRVDSNTAKLNLLQSTTPAPPTYAVDHERLSMALESDKRTIEQLMRRRDSIRFCVWEEVQWVHRCTSLLRTSLKELAQEESSFVRGVQQVWDRLAEQGLMA